MPLEQSTASLLGPPESLLQLGDINRIVNDDPLPKVRAVLHKLFVEGMILIIVLPGHIIKQHQLGSSVTAIDDVPLFGSSRHPDVKLADRRNLPQCIQSAQQRRQ